MILDHWWRTMLWKKGSRVNHVNIDFKLFPWKRKSQCSSAPFLLKHGTSMQKISLCGKYCIYMFQKIWAICFQCRWRKRRESRLKCCRGNKKIACQTAPTAIKLWLVVAALWQNNWAMRKHMGLSTQNYSIVWITSMINCVK